MRVKMIVSVTTGDGFFVASGTSTDLFTDEEAEDLVREGKAVAYRNERQEATVEDAIRVGMRQARKPKQRPIGRANS